MLSCVFSSLAAISFILSMAALGLSEAQAAPVGRIEGRVYNGTAGSAPLGGVEVALRSYAGSNEMKGATATTDGDGRFQFLDLETSPSYTYEVTVRYLEVMYRSSVLAFPQGVENLEVSLPVYEITRENPGLRVQSSSLLLAGAEESSRMLLAVERLELFNPSDRTYVPDPSGPGGPMSFLRFGLPPGAVDLTPHQGLEDGQIFQVDKGFASTMSLPPGGHEVVFAYRFPYEGGRVGFSKSFLYGADEFLVLAAKDKWTVDGSGLAAGEDVTIGNREFRLWTAIDLRPGSSLDLSIKGLPGGTGMDVTLGSGSAAVLGGTGVALVLVGCVVFALNRSRVGWRGLAGGPSLNSGEELAMAWRLVADMAELDDEHSEGKLAEEEYRARRERAKEELKALLKADGVELITQEAAVGGTGGGRDDVGRV